MLCEMLLSGSIGGFGLHLVLYMVPDASKWGREIKNEDFAA